MVLFGRAFCLFAMVACLIYSAVLLVIMGKPQEALGYLFGAGLCLVFYGVMQFDSVI